MQEKTVNITKIKNSTITTIEKQQENPVIQNQIVEPQPEVKTRAPNKENRTKIIKELTRPTNNKTKKIEE